MVVPLSSDGPVFIEAKSSKMPRINIGHQWLSFLTTNLVIK